MDWGRVARNYGEVFKQLGGVIVTRCNANSFEYTGTSTGQHDTGEVRVICSEKPPVTCNYVVTCAGLYSDKLSTLSGCSSNPKIVPFRGDYLVMKSHRSDLVRGNIYPVPDPQFPFLGVHFTPRMDGSMWLGPNAILAFTREGYQWNDFSLRETVDALSSNGLRNLLHRHWR